MKSCCKFWGLPRKRVWYLRELPWKLVGTLGSRNYFKSDLLRPWDMTHIIHTYEPQKWWYVRHDSFMCATWLNGVYDMTHSYVWYHSHHPPMWTSEIIMRATWLIYVCDMTQSYVRHDSFIRVISIAWPTHVNLRKNEVLPSYNHCVTVRCSVVQCVAVCCSMHLAKDEPPPSCNHCVTVCSRVVQCVPVFSSMDLAKDAVPLLVVTV